MISLVAAKGHQGGVAVIQSILNDVVQLSGFVAAQGQTCHVVPFDIQLALAQLLRQSGHILQGRVHITYRDVLQFIDLHTYCPFIIAMR